jgi:outer membrane murein-binding lipoprotein Lpp
MRHFIVCGTVSAWLALAGCASPAPPAATVAEAPMDQEALRAHFARMAADRAAMERLVSARYPQFGGRKRELMVDQTIAMFHAPGFADRVHDLIAPKLHGRGAAMPPGMQAAFAAELREQAAALGQQLTLKGMTRLPMEEQERFARNAIALHQGVDAATCRALIDGKVSATRMQQVEVTHSASLPDAEFEKLLAMSRRAMQAELAGAPPAPQLTPVQADAAQKAWGRAILARFKAPADKARYERVRADSERASDADTCWVTLHYLQAMLDLRGNERRWQLQSYMNDTASE